MSLAEATTVDLSPWAVRFRQRATVNAQPSGVARRHPAVRLLLGAGRWLFEAAWTLLFLAGVAVAVFFVVLAAREAAVNFIGWGWR